MDAKAAVVQLQGEFTSLEDLLNESASYIDDDNTPLGTLHMYERCIEDELKRCDTCWSQYSPFVTESDELDKLLRSYRAITRGGRKSLVTVRQTIATSASTAPVPSVPATPTLPPPQASCVKDTRVRRERGRMASLLGHF